MKVKINGGEYDYVPNKKHRNKTPKASQWRISQSLEIASFSQSIGEGWLDGNYSWGLHQVSGSCQYLGVDRDHITRVFIARFEAKATPAVWHGYPVNYAFERPPESVTKNWLSSGALAAAKVRKIIQGKRCSL